MSWLLRWFVGLAICVWLVKERVVRSLRLGIFLELEGCVGCGRGLSRLGSLSGQWPWSYGWRTPVVTVILANYGPYCYCCELSAMGCKVTDALARIEVPLLSS